MAPVAETLVITDKIISNLAAITAGSDYFFTPKLVTKEWRYWDEWQNSELPAIAVVPGDESFIPRGMRQIHNLPVFLYGTLEKRSGILIEEDIEKFRKDIYKKVESDPRLSGCLNIYNGKVIDVAWQRAVSAIGALKKNGVLLKTRALITGQILVKYTGPLNTAR